MRLPRDEIMHLTDGAEVRALFVQLRLLDKFSGRAGRPTVNRAQEAIRVTSAEHPTHWVIGTLVSDAVTGETIEFDAWCHPRSTYDEQAIELVLAEMNRLLFGGHAFAAEVEPLEDPGKN